MKQVQLFGDGIHDDGPAIQAMLDSGESLVYLPTPKTCYLIGQTLLIGSRQELRLDAYTRMVLKDNADCCMLENKHQTDGDEYITINGGIWDMNHRNQSPNPQHFPDKKTGLTRREKIAAAGYRKDSGVFFPAYCGHCFRFNRVTHFMFRNVTIENPVVYGVQIANADHFTFENVTFDYTEGSPKLWNMDGIHVEGGCKNGYIHNLHGACHDDTVAITSDDGLYGPIENITVDGIYAERSHSAVRLLSSERPVRNIHITNVFGTYYVYAVTLSNYCYFENKKGRYEHISIDHVHASFSEGTVDVPGNYYPLIAIDRELEITDLSIDHLYRREMQCTTPTVGVEKNTHIESLTLTDIYQSNEVGGSMALLSNAGTIDRVYKERLMGKDKSI